eukprot:gene2117-6239_t
MTSEKHATDCTRRRRWQRIARVRAEHAGARDHRRVEEEHAARQGL